MTPREAYWSELIIALALGVACYTAGFLTADGAWSWRENARMARLERPVLRGQP